MTQRNYYEGKACPECGQPVKVSYSRYCPKHMRLTAGYGHPQARAVNRAEMEHYRGIVGRGIAARITSAPVKAALDLAGLLLDYEPSSGYRWQWSMHEQFRRLKEGGVTARELLTETCAVFAMELLEDLRFPSPRAADYTAARQVLKLRNQGRFRPNSVLLKQMGGYLRDQLAAFAYAITREAAKFDTKRIELRERMLGGWGNG